MKKYSGKIQNIIFKNPDDNFYILKMSLDRGSRDPIIVTGKIFGISIKKGVWFAFEAKKHDHPKYGEQLKITKAPIFDTSTMTPQKVAEILQGQGVSNLVASAIVKKFGDCTYNILCSDEAHEALQTISGLNEISADFILQKWRDFLALHKTFDFFDKIGLSNKKYQQVFAHFGSRAKETITENPYLLTDVEGITFEQADAVASHLGFPKNSPKRVSGLILSAIKSDRTMGHLYLTPRQIYDHARRLSSSLKEKDLLIGIMELAQIQNPVTVTPITFVIPTVSFQVLGKLYNALKEGKPYDKQLYFKAFEYGSVYSQWNYTLEYWGADSLEARSRAKIPPIELEPNTLKEVYEESSLQLSELQEKAVKMVLNEPVSVITGLPGTGKTTTLKVLVNLLIKEGITFQLVAPTGIAAKRIAQVTGKPAYTIHRAFGSKGGKNNEDRESTYYGVVGDRKALGNQEQDQKNETWEKQLSANVLICDEASMVDQHLLYRILKGTHNRCRLVFVGDHAQLPSVGAGDVIKSLLGFFPSVSLTEIFRQSDTSDIVYAAHDIHKGKVPELGTTADSDFLFIPCESHSQIQTLILKFSERLYAKRQKFQVLSPRHSSELGVTELNQKLRELLNTTEEQSIIRVGSQFLRENDRVMIVKNDYDRAVFNGDTGKIYRIMQDKKVIVKIHGEQDFYVDFTPQEISKYLRLSYCTTVHKMQGQETGVILMPIVRMFSSQLQRNLLYTAITRAKKRVILIGHMDALSRCVSNHKSSERNTNLTEWLVKRKEENEAELNSALSL